MKIRSVLNLGCILHFLMLITLVSPLAYSNEPVLKLAFNDSQTKPLKWKENGEYTGPMLEIMREIGKRTGIEVDMIPQPFARTWPMIEQGLGIDGAFGNYRTPERTQHAIYFFPPIGFLYTRLYTSSDITSSPKSIADLEGKSIVTLIGHSISKEFDELVAGKKVQTIGVTSYGSMIEMLRLKHAKYAAAPQHTIDQIIKDKYYNNDVKKSSLLFAERPIYFYLSRKAETPQQNQLITQLSQTMREMEENRIFEQIHQNFGTSYRRGN